MIGGIEQRTVYAPDFGGMDMVPTPVGRQEARQISLQEKAPLFYHLDMAPIALRVMRHLAETEGSVDFYVNGPTSGGKQRTIEHFLYVMQRVGTERVFGEDATDEEREIEEKLKQLRENMGPIHYEVSNTAMGIMKGRVDHTITSPIGYFEFNEVLATSEAMAEMNRISNASSPKPRFRGIDTPGLYSDPGWPFGVQAIRESIALSQEDPSHLTIVLWLNTEFKLQEDGIETRERLAKKVQNRASGEDIRITAAVNNLAFEETDEELEQRRDVLIQTWGGRRAMELVRDAALQDAFDRQKDIREIDPGIPAYTLEDLYNSDNEGLIHQIQEARAALKAREFGIRETDIFVKANERIRQTTIPSYQVTIFERHAMYDIGEGLKILEERKRQQQG